MSGTGRAPGRAGGNGQAPRSAGKPRAPGAGGARYAPADTGAEMGQPQQQNNQKINEVNEKLATVRTVMTENMQKALDRGEQLDSIEQKSDVLLEDANKFQHSAAATKRMFCRRHWRNVLIIAVLASLLLALVIWWASS